jgi:hypothetical protein
MTTPTLPADEVPTCSPQLFSETVAIARAGEPVPVTDWAYEFSDGHKFDDAKGASG